MARSLQFRTAFVCRLVEVHPMQLMAGGTRFLRSRVGCRSESLARYLDGLRLGDQGDEVVHTRHLEEQHSSGVEVKLLRRVEIELNRWPRRVSQN